MANERYDLVIVGGGIGGGALAVAMAREGKSVLLLERTTEYPDRVRGEWIAPWGVVEAKKLGLFDLFMQNGGHQLGRHISFGEETDPDAAIAQAMDLREFLGVGGPLCIRHPVACQALADEAARLGATVLRGISGVRVTPGPSPEVAYSHDGAERTASARLVVGADGRNGVVRQQAGITLHRDPTHHFFTGMLVENAHGWPEDVQTKGTEGDVNFLAFPQGKGVVRLYLGYGLDQKNRLAGADAQQRFLDAFRLQSCPWSEAIVNSTPISWCHSYPNEDTWTDVPYVDGVLLVGDAAGHNDPIIGQGLSITLRDVRMAWDALKANDDWDTSIFQSLAEERRERMRKLRFAAWITSIRDSEFGPEARARRIASAERVAANPALMLPVAAVMMGPEMAPGEAFNPQTWEAILGPGVPYPASLAMP